jgi:ABC-type glycerol-3-phosphate transport system substrate-binding protein
LTATALIVGLVAAGCGSSSSSTKTTSSTATTALTKTQFLARANAICTTGNNQIAAADAKLSKNPTQAQITAVVKTTTAPSIQAQIDGIRALGAPPGDQATVTNMLNLAQADLNKVKSNPSVLAAGGASPFADFAKVAHPYGLTACAQNA